MGGCKGGGVLGKHLQEHHGGAARDKAQVFSMRGVKGSRTVLDRLVQEGTNINQTDMKYPQWLMNSKSEWGKGKMVRYEPTITRI